MPCRHADDRAEDYVSSAFRPENVAVEGSRTRFERSSQRARAARWRSPACRWPRSSPSGLPSSCSFICREAPLAEPNAPQMSSTSERRWAWVVAGVVVLRVRRDRLRRRALGRATSVERGNDRCQPPAPCPASSWRPISAPRCSRTDRSIVRVIAEQYSFVPACIVVPAETQVVFRVTSPDVVHGFLIAGTNVNSMVVPGFVAEVRTRFDRPGEHLMPCHEYCSVGHEGMWARVKVVDRARIRAILWRPAEGILCTVVAASSSPISGPPSRSSPSMIPLGAWQMLVRSPLHRWVDPELYYRAVTAHGTTLAYVFPTLIAMGFGYAVCAVSLGRPMHGMRLAWASFWLVIAGAVMAVATVAAGKATVLYTFYPPLHGQPVLLPRRPDRGGRLVDLDRPHGLALRALEARPSGPAGSAGDVRHHGRRAALGLDVIGGRRGDRVPDPAQCLRLDRHDRCRSRAAAVLLDPARHRLLLADPRLHRVLRAAAAGRRRPAVQRQDGPHRVSAAAGLLDADRHSSSLRRSADRCRLQVSPRRVHRHGRGTDAAHDLHHLRFARDRGPLARRARPVRVDRRLAMGSAVRAGFGAFAA